jgi:hypothetical protein
VSTVAQGSAKAWVNFNGTGTVAIRASFNVSSITDNGTGDYTVNFTNALVDADYAVVGTSTAESHAGTLSLDVSSPPATAGFRFFTYLANVATGDSSIVNVAVFR